MELTMTDEEINNEVRHKVSAIQDECLVLIDELSHIHPPFNDKKNRIPPAFSDDLDLINLACNSEEPNLNMNEFQKSQAELIRIVGLIFEHGAIHHVRTARTALTVLRDHHYKESWKTVNKINEDLLKSLNYKSYQNQAMYNVGAIFISVLFFIGAVVTLNFEFNFSFLVDPSILFLHSPQLRQFT